MTGDRIEPGDRIESDDGRPDATDAVTGPVGSARLRSPAEIGHRESGLDDLADLTDATADPDETTDQGRPEAGSH